MKSQFASLALAVALALPGTAAFARSHHHRSYDHGYYRSYNSMNMMRGPLVVPRDVPWMGGYDSLAGGDTSGGPGGGGGGGGGP
jgi:hypothetical protein